MPAITSFPYHNYNAPCKTHHWSPLAEKAVFKNGPLLGVDHFFLRKWTSPVGGIGMFPKIVGFPPKSSILVGFSMKNPSIVGYPKFWKHPYGNCRSMKFIIFWGKDRASQDTLVLQKNFPCFFFQSWFVTYLQIQPRKNYELKPSKESIPKGKSLVFWAGPHHSPFGPFGPFRFVNPRQWAPSSYATPTTWQELYPKYHSLQYLDLWSPNVSKVDLFFSRKLTWLAGKLAFFNKR